ncbi:MAG: hypothetical protein WCD79_16710 [Chthoniobacteraceae bacterium]
MGLKILQQHPFPFKSRARAGSRVMEVKFFIPGKGHSREKKTMGERTNSITENFIIFQLICK